MLTETFLRYGQPDPPMELIALQAGPLTMLYDPTTGMVRRIKLGKVEVLRGIYAAVRDRNWGTVAPLIREQTRSVGSDSFSVEFESEHQQVDIHFQWRGMVRGEADGTLCYQFDGEAKTTFLRNRIGFCVLHPLSECAGAQARQFRIDGTEVECAEDSTPPGWRGVMERTSGSPLPEKFPSIPGAPFPVCHMLAHLAGFSEVSFMSGSSPQTLSGLGLFTKPVKLRSDREPHRCEPNRRAHASESP